jgi:hypothetical protein
VQYIHNCDILRNPLEHSLWNKSERQECKIGTKGRGKVNEERKVRECG